MKARAFRKTFWLALLATLTLVGGCAAIQRGPEAPARLQQILDAGELRIGVTGDLPPLNMKDRNGDFMGLEIDLVRELGAAMNLRVRFVERRFADLLPALRRGEVDLVVAGLTMTPERNARVAFAGPYFISGTSILSKSEEIADVEDPAALDVAGRTYVALEGSTSAAFIRDRLPRSRLVTAADYESGVQMVLDDDADGLVADFQVCTLAEWRNSGAGLHTMMTPFTTEPLGIALPPDAPLLLNLVTNYLNTLERTGMLAQLKAKWLTDGAWTSDLP
jgi:polar amino acid transport system substrate-binding protein